MNEKIKNYLGWAIIIAILITAAAAWRMAKTYANSAEPGSYRSFAVSAEGRAVGVPDVAQFTFEVINEGGKEIAALQKGNIARVNRAIDYLKSKNIAKEDIKTEGYNLEPRYESVSCNTYRAAGGTVCPPPSIAGYTVRTAVSVKVRQDRFDVLGEVLSGVIERGANDVTRLYFTVDDQIKLENVARAEAMARAKAKAKALAAAGGFRLGRLLGIDEGGTYPMYEKYGRGGDVATFSMASNAPAPIIEPGSQEVFVNLTLRYEIK